MRNTYYRNLRVLMAKHRLTQNDISEISGLSVPSISKKFTKGEEFKITPACKILKHFRALGETVDFETLFCEGFISKASGQ
jgi:transcriptional regulator with XRE-family HTH domain